MRAGGDRAYEVVGLGRPRTIYLVLRAGEMVGLMVRAKKALRTGVFDVIVASEGCMSLDLISEARRTN